MSGLSARMLYPCPCRKPCGSIRSTPWPSRSWRSNTAPKRPSENSAPATDPSVRLQATLHEHRADVGIAAAEIAEHLPVVQRVPLRENQIAEPLAVRARQAAVLGEPRERIVVQHLRPEIGVVARVVAVGPDVQEVAGTIAR